MLKYIFFDVQAALDEFDINQVLQDESLWGDAATLYTRTDALDARNTNVDRPIEEPSPQHGFGALVLPRSLHDKTGVCCAAVAPIGGVRSTYHHRFCSDRCFPPLPAAIAWLWHRQRRRIFRGLPAAVAPAARVGRLRCRCRTAGEAPPERRPATCGAAALRGRRRR